MENPSALRVCRQKRKLTLAAAAARFGVHKTTFMRWERHRVPSDQVLRIEKELGLKRHQIRPDLYPPPRVRVDADVLDAVETI